MIIPTLGYGSYFWATKYHVEELNMVENVDIMRISRSRDDECDPFKVPSRIKAFARSAVLERPDRILFILLIVFVLGVLTQRPTSICPEISVLCASKVVDFMLIFF